MVAVAPKRQTQPSNSSEDILRALRLIKTTPKQAVQKALNDDLALKSDYLKVMARALASAAAFESLSYTMELLDVPIQPAAAGATQATENFWRNLESEFGFLTSSELAKALGASNSNRAYASNLRKNDKIAGIARKNLYLYPSFQIDLKSGVIRPWVAPLLGLAKEYQRTPSGAMMWMAKPSTYFNGSRPVDMLANSELILSGAQNDWSREW